MAILYVDLVNGNDANNGSTWALAKKTLASAGTAATIGDEIRIAKSPDPVSLGNGTWTNGGEIITLATARNQTLYKEGAWTAAADVTSNTNTSRKIGATNARITPGAGFTSGKLAYYDLGSAQNLSGYNRVSFWFQTSANIAAGIVTLELCSDALGDTPVNTFAIPAFTNLTGSWVVLTIDGGGALGSSIRSLALHATASIGTQQMQLDCIIACESGGPDLGTLFTKGSTIDGTHALFAPMYIDGTEVRIDYGPINTLSSTFLRGYAGTTETVTTYAVQPIDRGIIATSGTTVNDNVVNQAGSDSSGTVLYTKYLGGWDTGTTTRNGYTVVSGNSGGGNGLLSSSTSFVEVAYFGLIRYSSGLNISNSTGAYAHDCFAVSCGNNGMYCSNRHSNYDNLHVYGHGNFTSSNPINVVNADYSVLNNCVAETCSSAGINVTGTSYRVRVLGFVARRCLSGISANISESLLFVEPVVSDCTNAAITSSNGGSLVGSSYGIFRPTFTGNSGITATISNATFIRVHDYPSVGLHTIYTEAGGITYQKDEFQTGASGAWKLDVVSSGRGIGQPLRLTLLHHFCLSGAGMSIKVWVKKSHATQVGGSIRVLAEAHTSIATSVIATAANNTDWQQLELSFTCSHDEVIAVEAFTSLLSGSPGHVLFSGPIEIVSTPPFNIDTFDEVNLAEDIALV